MDIGLSMDLLEIVGDKEANWPAPSLDVGELED